MKKRITFLAIALIAMGLLTSCVSRLGAFTVISTKNIDWSRASEYKRYNQRVTGEDVCHIVIVIPTKANITIEDAVDNALNQVPGGIALVDAVLRQKFFYIPYIYGQESYIIEGSVLVDPMLADVNAEETKYYQGIFNQKNDLVVSEITKTDYIELENAIEKSAKAKS